MAHIECSWIESPERALRAKPILCRGQLESMGSDVSMFCSRREGLRPISAMKACSVASMPELIWQREEVNDYDASNETPNSGTL